ncbi:MULTISPECIES: HupE/UreJ family protein [Enterobacteriaceae]|uniref:HupE/UreJ family protein n=1 Tax=Enterobacteriaceae TaxID=543 RepID=UPI00024F1E6D|nr:MULTISPECIES: HupE/UreJ family protein [Enterobacteriaceae]EFC6552369.1 HupE/UreJ family protein [Escherichia coli]EBB7791853.1 HupE/UreJ family protein [Salmonella enterica subsp. enterica serovar Senftenberg]EBF7042220.1 HupE/UreJ family protein [Salmonella enterica subsp. enterica serovar Senftenberg]EFL7416975.1 HupE/UreJ family protein [Escherichia coli]EFN4126696.1 HupE/UreJ family protein [Escherichia coli]
MNINIKAAPVFVLALFPMMAFAHVGTDGGTHHVLSFTEGFIHPLTGMDHMVAMVLVGVWSAMNTRQWWLAPLAFAGLLLTGALAGMAGVMIAGTEYIVAGSLLGIGAMVALQLKLREGIGALIIGVFAIFHGLAHGAELSHSTAALSGMVTATAGLHLTGLGIGSLVTVSSTRHLWSRVLGGCSSLLGIGLMAGVI